MASYKPVRNPLLPPDPMDLMPSPVAAARMPGKFLARKLAAMWKRQGKVYDQFLKESENINRFYEQAGQNPAAVPEMGDYLDLMESTNALLKTADQRAVSASQRANDALELWRLRNLPIGETIRRSLPGKPDLYEWYRQALKDGPWQP